MLKGLLVPADPEVAITDIEGPDYSALLKTANITWLERVNGRHSRDHGFCGLVEDDGRMMTLRRNYRAQWLLGYGLDGEANAFIVGPCVLVSDAPSPDGGVDLVSLTDEARTWIMHPDRAGDAFANYLHSAKARMQSMSYDGGAIGGFGRNHGLEPRH